MKTIAIAFFGGVVKDDITPIEGFHKISSKIKEAGHKIRIYTEGEPDFMHEWCLKNKSLPLDGENYDYLISPLAIGTPLTFDGYVDWSVMEVLLENLNLIPSTPRQSGLDKLKFDVEGIKEVNNDN